MGIKGKPEGASVVIPYKFLGYYTDLERGSFKSIQRIDRRIVEKRSADLINGNESLSARHRCLFCSVTLLLLYMM